MSRWFARQRQAFLAERLKVSGRVNRSEIAHHFDVSVQTASADIQAFIAAHPGAVAYDLSAKCYRSTAQHDPGGGPDKAEHQHDRTSGQSAA